MQNRGGGWEVGTKADLLMRAMVCYLVQMTNSRVVCSLAPPPLLCFLRTAFSQIANADNVCA